MKKEPHISEFKTKKGSGLEVRVSTTRDGQKISVNGGRFYYFDYSSKSACLRAARAERDKILVRLEIAQKPSEIRPTIGELFEQSFTVLPVAASTQEEYRSIFRNSLVQLSGTRIDKVTLQQVQLSVNEFALEHSKNRVTLLLNVWRRIYQTAFYLQIPVVDYSRMIHPPKSRVQIRRKIKETDLVTFRRYLSALDESGSYFAPICRNVALIMFYTGMRIQEALGLCVEDVDFDAGILRIQRSCGSDATKSAVLVPLKTEQSRRTLPIVPGLDEVLRELVDRAEGDLLFTAPDGGPVNVKNLSLLTNDVCKRHGIKFTLYTLRHLFSADLFRQGINPKIIQSLMGHASADMSAYYAFTTEDERNEAMKNRLLN